MQVKPKIDETTEQAPIIKEQDIKKIDTIQNTEIIDILWDEDALESSVQWNEWMIFSDTNMMSDNFATEETQNLNNVEQNIPEWYYIDEDLFIKFCNEKKGIMKDNICSYWEIQCSREDFTNKKCK